MWDGTKCWKCRRPTTHRFALCDECHAVEVARVHAHDTLSLTPDHPVTARTIDQWPHKEFGWGKGRRVIRKLEPTG